MLRRNRLRNVHAGFEVWDPDHARVLGHFERLEDGWLVMDVAPTDGRRVGYLPRGAVDFVDAPMRRIVLRTGTDTRHVLDARASVDRTAEQVVDAIAHIGLFGFWPREDGTFLDPR